MRVNINLILMSLILIKMDMLIGSAPSLGSGFKVKTYVDRLLEEEKYLQLMEKFEPAEVVAAKRLQLDRKLKTLNAGQKEQVIIETSRRLECLTRAKEFAAKLRTSVDVSKPLK